MIEPRESPEFNRRTSVGQRRNRSNFFPQSDKLLRSDYTSSYGSDPRLDNPNDSDSLNSSFTDQTNSTGMNSLGISFPLNTNVHPSSPLLAPKFNPTNSISSSSSSSSSSHPVTLKRPSAVSNPNLSSPALSDPKAYTTPSLDHLSSFSNLNFNSDLSRNIANLNGLSIAGLSTPPNSTYQSIWSNHPTSNTNSLSAYATPVFDDWQNDTPRMEDFSFNKSNEHSYKSNDHSFDKSFDDFPPEKKLDNADMSFEKSDMLFSPFLSSHKPPEFSPELKKHNIYLSKLNTPSFIPSYTPVQEIPTTKKDKNKPLDFEFTHENQLIERRIQKIDDRMIKSIKLDRKDPPVLKEMIPISFPRKDRRNGFITEKILSKIFLLQISSTAVKYEEDYCSTFYKRNKHRYMFIKETSNSLKVNSGGGKSWVTIKLNLGPDNTQLKKKLKVDIKDLPVWKPMNVQPHTSGDRSRRRSSTKSDDGTRKQKYENGAKRSGKRF